MKIDFNANWQYRQLNSQFEWQTVDLPHDALICENRTSQSRGAKNIGWYEGLDYEYQKTFTLDQQYKNKVLTLEFEGVYRNAEVFINGQKVAYRPYGYTNFYVNVTKYVLFDQINTIRVIAKNSDQPNSRWYSGTGIYRPVFLHVQEKKHILLNGIKVRTVQLSPAIVEVVVTTTDGGEICLSINDGDQQIYYTKQSFTGKGVFNVEIPDAKYWSPDTPHLYALQVRYGEDVKSLSFGVRQIECDAQNGFQLNGKRVILRGACIHHDNGILGARCFADAEERKVALLKENGYNAIRSAHNPCSKALLDACDKLGMLVIDEYVDMWYIHKTKYDYANYIMDWWQQDLADMIDKDFNHPSVIMYSLGNEVAETGQKEGIEFFQAMQDLCHKLDPYRKVTTGVNIFFNYLHALGFGVYTDKKAEEEPNKKVGSEFFNNLAGLFGATFMKTMALLPGCDKKTKDCFGVMDVAGYNYGILRYKGDLKKYPSRVILGSETFCSDAYKFYNLAKKNNALIGDFVWAGMDYLGEVGIGSWEYKDYAKDFLGKVGWVSAGSGRLDLLGNPLGEALYTKVAFELEQKPQIAVRPVNHTKDRHSPSAWKFTNAIPSWSWSGFNGCKAIVEVYSRAPKVALYLNGELVGKKSIGKNCRYIFKTKYFDGTLVAVALDKNDKEIAQTTLTTAKEQTILSVRPEKEKVKRGQLCFVHLDYTDCDGQIKPLERGIITVKVQGGKLLAVGSACPYNEMSYLGDKTDTYFGRAMAVVQAEEDVVILSASDGTNSGSCQIDVE